MVVTGRRAPPVWRLRPLRAVVWLSGSPRAVYQGRLYRQV